MDYIKKFELDLDIAQVKLSCEYLRDIIMANSDFNNEGIPMGPATTRVFNQYNLLLYPFDEFYNFYMSLCKIFNSIVDDSEDYYAQSWINFYKYNEYLDWHNHFPPEANSYHGFLCVDAEDSVTSYKLPDNDMSQVDVPAKNGQLIISKSAGDLHRTYPWPHKDRDRLTVAFDIVPKNNISWGQNHWAPIAKVN
jgi:hypothetical protein